MLASWEMPWSCKGKMIKKLVKLASEQLLQMLGFNVWGMENVP
jgi:hypothetical protein